MESVVTNNLSLIILVCFSAFNLLLGLVIYRKNPNNKLNAIFLTLCVTVILWTTSNYYADLFYSTLWFRLGYILGAWVITTGLIWTNYLIGEFSISRVKTTLLIGTVASALPIHPNFLGEGNPYTTIYTEDKFSVYLILYALFYFYFLFLIIQKIIRKFLSTHEYQARRAVFIVLIGATVTLFITAFTSFIAPIVFTRFLPSAIDSIGFSFFTLSIVYSIGRYNLFEIKLIATEAMTYLLWFVLLTKTFVSASRGDMILNATMLIICFVLGIILIKVMAQNIRQRKEIDNLTKHIQKRIG